MYLLRVGEPGAEKPAALDKEGGFRDLSSLVEDIDGRMLGRADLDRLREVRLEDLPLLPGDSRIGPCLGTVGNFIAVGLNYADHAAEANLAAPAEPILFNKAPSSVCGPNDDVILPRGAEKTDWEVEIAVVIGKPVFDISEEEAVSAIAGYCVCNDISERGFQLERGGQWMKGKSAPTFGPLGPYLVTPDEIADIHALKMTLDVNGERMQDGTTADMIFKIPFLVSYISRFMRLMPGDVITTGTPAGIGGAMKPPRFLKSGDRMEVSIEKLGTQRNRVVAA